jgi:hypothetical protein
LFGGLDDGGRLKKKVDTLDKLLSRILDAAAHIKKTQDHLRRTTHHLCTRVAKYIEVDGGMNICCEM